VLDAGTGGTESTGADDLLSACCAIGRKMGVRFRPAPESWHGKTYEPISALARASHVRYRVVALDGEWWRRDNGPLLAFRDEDGAPIALLPASSRSYRAHLPGAAPASLVSATLAATIRPKAYMFYRPLPERALRGRDILKYVLRGNRRDIVAVCLIALLAAAIALALPIATNLVFSYIVPAGDPSPLITVAVVLLVLAVTMGVFAFTRGVMTVRVQARIDNELQAAIWDRLLSLPPSFFRGFTAGDLATRVMSINQICTIAFNSVVGSLMASVFSLVNVVLIYTFSPQLALLAVVLFVIGVSVSVGVALLQLRERRKVLEQQGWLSGIVLQFVSAVAKLRDTGAEERAFMRWSDGFVEMTRHTLKATRITIWGNVFNAAFPLVCSAAAFSIFYYSLSGTYATGTFMAYTASFAQLLAGLFALSLALVAMTTAAPLYERIKPILEALPEADETKADPGELCGRIEMDHVTFSYDPDGPPTIRDLSLEVRPGEFVAIVGPSGAGKSTLFRLLLGFDAPSSGEIHYDGLDLRTLDLGALRRQISTVLQNGRVFSGSIRMNIAGAAQLTQDEVWEAATKAGLADDIEAMPMGMFTYVAEGGVTLSGGQRQRLLIARALSTKPAILFFDEATSALDNRTQALVMRSLEEVNATRLVIAQRLSTVRAADRIYVLEDGGVAQVGSYDELMSKPGLFQRLVERQLV
jgi:ATP-binding cassette subfamily C protein